jgi:hypothetical protein
MPMKVPLTCAALHKLLMQGIDRFGGRCTLGGSDSHVLRVC